MQMRCTLLSTAAICCSSVLPKLLPELQQRPDRARPSHPKFMILLRLAWCRRRDSHTEGQDRGMPQQADQRSQDRASSNLVLTVLSCSDNMMT